MHLLSTPDAVRRAMRRYPLLAPAGVGLAAASLLAYVGAVDPNEAGHYPSCPYYFVTGLYCPGCGTLRMIHAIAHGNIAEAFHRNMLVFSLLLPMLVFMYAQWTVRLARGRPRSRPADPRLIWALFVVVVMFTVLRNIPMFHFMAPA